MEEEIANITARLNEADEADDAYDPADELRKRINQAQDRLSQVESALRQSPDDRRLQAEADQLRGLLQELLERGELSQQDERPGRKKVDEMSREARETAKKLAEDGLKRMVEDLKVCVSFHVVCLWY